MDLCIEHMCYLQKMVELMQCNQIEVVSEQTSLIKSYKSYESILIFPQSEISYILIKIQHFIKLCLRITHTLQLIKKFCPYSLFFHTAIPCRIKQDMYGNESLGDSDSRLQLFRNNTNTEGETQGYNCLTYHCHCSLKQQRFIL